MSNSKTLPEAEGNAMENEQRSFSDTITARTPFSEGFVQLTLVNTELHHANYRCPQGLVFRVHLDEEGKHVLTYS